MPIQNKHNLVTGSGRITRNFEFDASRKLLSINEPDFNGLLYAVNVTRDIIFFDPASSGKGYTFRSNNEYSLEYDTTAMDDTDIILVIYEPGNIHHDEILEQLHCICDELKNQTKLLSKIYK